MRDLIQTFQSELAEGLTNEIIIHIGDTPVFLFLQEGAYNPFGYTNNSPHKHIFTEIHLIVGGRVRYVVDKETLALCPGDLLVIPAGFYHDTLENEETARRMIFMTNLPTEAPIQKHISSQRTENILLETKRAFKTKNNNRLILHLALLCDELFSFPAGKIKPIRDESYIITECFNRCMNSNSPTLSSLARMLCVSEKQAERLVFKHTGMTYKKAVIQMRKETAQWMIENTDLSLSEIAQRVGYRSYSGFYKACLQKK